MRLFYYLLLFSFIFVPFQKVVAQFVVPPLSAPVVDQAGLFKPNQIQSLNEALKNIYSTGGPQINVLTVKSLNGLSIEDASMEVVKSWKLGTAAKDNGALLMVSLNDRKVRIEVGQGLEGEITDAYSKRIIDNDIIPYFKQGQYGLGIIKGVQGILLHLDKPLHLNDYITGENLNSFDQQSPSTSERYSNLILILIIILFVLINFIFGGRSGRGGGYYGGGGFGGSGGGWSGGGGGFSGGGASGSW